MTGGTLDLTLGDDGMWRDVVSASIFVSYDLGGTYTADEADFTLLVCNDAGEHYIDWDALQSEDMHFTNTYTKSISEPTEPAESNQNTGAMTNPQTGDNSNPALWFALLAVSAAGVIGTGVYSKRRKSSRAK